MVGKPGKRINNYNSEQYSEVYPHTWRTGNTEQQKARKSSFLGDGEDRTESGNTEGQDLPWAKYREE